METRTVLLYCCEKFRKFRKFIETGWKIQYNGVNHPWKFGNNVRIYYKRAKGVPKQR